VQTRSWPFSTWTVGTCLSSAKKTGPFFELVCLILSRLSCPRPLARRNLCSSSVSDCVGLSLFAPLNAIRKCIEISEARVTMPHQSHCYVSSLLQLRTRIVLDHHEHDHFTCSITTPTQPRDINADRHFRQLYQQVPGPHFNKLPHSVLLRVPPIKHMQATKSASLLCGIRLLSCLLSCLLSSKPVNNFCITC